MLRQLHKVSTLKVALKNWPFVKKIFQRFYFWFIRLENWIFEDLWLTNGKLVLWILICNRATLIRNFVPTASAIQRLRCLWHQRVCSQQLSDGACALQTVTKYKTNTHNIVKLSCRLTKYGVTGRLESVEKWIFIDNSNILRGKSVKRIVHLKCFYSKKWTLRISKFNIWLPLSRNFRQIS